MLHTVDSQLNPFTREIEDIDKKDYDSGSLDGMSSLVKNTVMGTNYFFS